MPAFSGLWDAVHGDAHALTADAGPPQSRGIVRAIMQTGSMHGHVTGLGRNAPATRSRIDADRADVTTRGGYDYATRSEDGANQVTLTNHASHVDGAAINETVARVSTATAGEMAETYDTTKKVGYYADEAANGVTSQTVAEDIGT